MSCYFTGELYFYKHGNNTYPFALTKRINFNEIYEKIQIKEIIGVLGILSEFKIKILFRFIMNKIRKMENGILGLHLNSWPNKYNIDLNDIKKLCQTSQLSKNGEFPFCYSLILNSKGIIDL
jgi:hypothetical protein